ncbi:MAG: hypothetical protein L6422_03300 [Candidatus Marinimicrobia bacterium]|nr:hypothetical protein [Candidatus Neomarinimicrobiota bacterium]
MLIIGKRIYHLFIIILFSISLSYAQWTNIDWKVHNVGKVRQLITNMGTLDDSGEKAKTTYPGLLYCEMPPGSNEEHIYQGGIWIGAITPDGDTLVSVSRTHFTPHEFYPSAEPWDTVWVATKGDTLDIPYWPNYSAVSDQDFICRYRDHNITNIENHVPLYLDVIQRSYAWSSPPLDEFIVLSYDIIPTKIDLHDVFIGIWMHGEIGNNDVGVNFIDELTKFFPEKQMAVGEDGKGGDDGNTISPIGIKVLEPADSSLKWSYKWYDHEDFNNYGRDPVRYKEAMCSGVIMQDRPDQERFHVTICFGPYESLAVGDTIHFEVAEVFGYGSDALFENAEYLEFLRDRDYKVPSPPPKPPLMITTSSQQVYLNWEPSEGKINPENYIDPYRGDNSPQPFEGYRVYKSTVSEQGPWTLLAELDLKGNKYGNNTGIEHDYLDVGLLNNMEYFYTVTAFSKPDSVTAFPSQESSLSGNAVVAVPGTAQPETVGKVAVVPNPYRGDIAYDSYNPQWEKPSGTRKRWMEQDRRVQFINLPNNCDIKIYTLAGDLVYTKHHEGDIGYWDWNLTSYMGQTIGSGIYMFSVEDKSAGKVQIGKFVVIK